MRNSIFFTQLKPITPKMLGILLLVLALLSTYGMEAQPSQVIVMVVTGLALLGYSISYEICEGGSHFKHFKLFRITIIKTSFKLFHPDLIRVFPTLHSKSSDWGPVAAMGKQNNDKVYVVRLFNANKHFTVFRTSSFDAASLKAEQLGKILDSKVDIQK